MCFFLSRRRDFFDIRRIPLFAFNEIRRKKLSDFHFHMILPRLPPHSTCFSRLPSSIGIVFPENECHSMSTDYNRLQYSSRPLE